jgi:hypothetical protein
MKFISVWLLLVFQLILKPSLGTLQAEPSIPPDQVRISTPVYSPDPSFVPSLGTYRYEVSWQGIPAAEAKLTVVKSDKKYHFTAVARSYKVVDLLYRLRYLAKGVIDETTMKPESLTVDHQENSRRKFYEVSFASDGRIRSERKKNGVLDEVYDFVTNNFTLDPFSAAFLSRALSWKVGDEKYLDVFNGKSRYAIKLKAIKRGKEFLQGKNREVFVISPFVLNLTKPKVRQKLRKASIFLTDDSKRDVLEIQSDVFIGKVRVKLTSFTPV